MGLFGKKFENPSFTEDDLIKRAESSIDMLEGDLKSRNWTEIWGNLAHDGLCNPSINEKMSPEAQEKFKSLITETKEVFNAEKENVDKDLVSSIQEALDKIS